MIERHPRFMYRKIQKSSSGFWNFYRFLVYFNKAAFFLWFMRFLLLERDNFLSDLFVFCYAVYWRYSPYKVKGSQVLPLFSRRAKTFRIHSCFSEHQMLLPLEWNGSSSSWHLFHSGCFRACWYPFFAPISEIRCHARIAGYKVSIAFKKGSTFRHYSCSSCSGMWLSFSWNEPKFSACFTHLSNKEWAISYSLQISHLRLLVRYKSTNCCLNSSVYPLLYNPYPFMELKS